MEKSTIKKALNNSQKTIARKAEKMKTKCQEGSLQGQVRL